MRRRALLGVAGASLGSLAGCLGATEYRIADARVDASSAPVALDVAVVEPNAVVEHPARIEFTVTNRRDAPVRVRNTGIWPLGLLELVPSVDAESAAGTILWTSRYEESEYVDAESRNSYGTESTPLVRTLDPGASASETYEVHGEDLYRAGTSTSAASSTRRSSNTRRRGPRSGARSCRRLRWTSRPSGSSEAPVCDPGRDPTGVTRRSARARRPMLPGREGRP